MSAQCEVAGKLAAAAPMSLFERGLTLWVALCIVVGVLLGQWMPGPFQALGRMEVAQVNIPVGLLIWVMIIPMLMKIDFGALHQVKSHWKGIGVTLFVNWAVKPFSMALLAWLFIRHLFAPYLPAEQLDSYVAGLILLAAAPCTAMVFVWSRLTGGDPYFTLSQVALNDAIMIFAFAPIVALLLGLSAIIVPWDTLLTSVVLYIVVPVAAQTRADGVRCDDGPARPRFHFGAAGDTGAAVRLPGRGHHCAAADHRVAGGADPDPGVFQLGAGLLAQPQGRREAQRGRPVGADRRVQFLRAGGRGGDCPVRLSVGCGAGHRGRGADRGAGDAAGGEMGQSKQGLVRVRHQTIAGGHSRCLAQSDLVAEPLAHLMTGRKSCPIKAAG